MLLQENKELLQTLDSIVLWLITTLPHHWMLLVLKTTMRLSWIAALLTARSPSFDLSFFASVSFGQHICVLSREREREKEKERERRKRREELQVKFYIPMHYNVQLESIIGFPKKKWSHVHRISVSVSFGTSWLFKLSLFNMIKIFCFDMCQTTEAVA